MSMWRRGMIRALSVRRSRWAVLLVALVGIATATAPVMDLWDKAEVFFELKPDSLHMARDTAKGSFSRELMQTAWGRLFWMRQFASSVEDDLPTEAQITSWDKYVEALDHWNKDLMVNIMTLREYYDDDKAKDFEFDIQSRFAQANICMRRIRFRADYEKRSDATCVFGNKRGGSAIENIHQLNRSLDELNEKLFCFTSGLTTRGQWCSKPGVSPGLMSRIFGHW